MSVVDTSLPPALFTFEELGIRIAPTIAMREGKQAVFQCHRCGLVAVQTNLAPEPLGTCPACRHEDGWSQQQLPVAGLYNEHAEPAPPVLEHETLTPYGRHHGLGPGTFADPFCGDAYYGAIESSGRRVWIWHACTATGDHELHKCDRCEETW